MAEKIRVLIVDDIPETRENINRMLMLEERIEVVGEAGNGKEAVELAGKVRPDIILMDINMPEMDGIQATEAIVMKYPQISIIMLSVQGEQEYLRKAMIAGAREYLTKPPSIDELVNSIIRVYEVDSKRRTNMNVQWQQETAPEKPCKIITVFSTKGGVGKSTIAVNLAFALKQITKEEVLLMDLDLQFGDVAILCDLVPKRNIVDLVGEIENKSENMDAFITVHSSGVKVLPAPMRPEYAEIVQTKHIEAILNYGKKKFSYIVIDTPPSFQDITLNALDYADEILLVTGLDLPTIKDIKVGLEVLYSLHFSKDRIKLVLNRSGTDFGVKVDELEKSLNMPISFNIPSDGKVVMLAANRGVPFTLEDSRALISQSIIKMAQILIGNKELELKKEKESRSKKERAGLGKNMRLKNQIS